MATKYEMSKTYQYRKVMKPLLERKRRARINKCLDDLKDIMGACMQSESGDPNVKLEKADILELTVNHLRKLKLQRQQQPPHAAAKKSFRSGYIHAANEVSRCLATLPNVNIALGTRLMTHLGLRLNQLETADVEPQQQQAQATAINTPLNINCNNSSINLKTCTQQAMYSPTSSGYDSDTDSSHSSTSFNLHEQTTQGLLQVATQVWRPW